MDLQNKALLWSEPELAGYMEKCGGGSTNWNRRFFLLQGSYLFYYANCVDVPTSDAMGVIPLEGAEVDNVDFENASEVLGSRRFCFELKLENEVGALAKRKSYTLSAPSLQAMNIWMRSLDLASYPRSYLFGELQAVRENAGLLEALLKKSPSNLKDLETPQGRESAALQDEIKKVCKEYKNLKEVAKQTWAQAEELKKITLQALAVWEITSDHIGGKNDKENCNTVTRLKEETSVTQQLLELLSEKNKFMHGEGVDDLPKAAREQLQLICTRGIANIQDRRAQVRAVAPRYASSIHPVLLPEGVEDPVPTLQDLQVVRGNTRPSRGSGGPRKFAELSEKWMALKSKVESRTLGSLIHNLKAKESQPEMSQTNTHQFETNKSTELQPEVSKSKDTSPPPPPSPPPPLEIIKSKDSPHSTTAVRKEAQLPETTRTEEPPRSEPPKIKEIQRVNSKGKEPQPETSAIEEPRREFFGIKELELEPPREELVPAHVRLAHYLEQIAQFCKQYLQRFQSSTCLDERSAHGLQHPSPYLVRNCLHRSPPLTSPTEAQLGSSSSSAVEKNVRCPRHQRLHDNPCFRMEDCYQPIRDLELADRETHSHRRHLQWHQQRHQYHHQQQQTQQGEIHQGRQSHGYMETTGKQRHQSPEFCLPKQQHQRRHSSRTSRDVRSRSTDARCPSSCYNYPGQQYPIRSFLPPGESRYLSPELYKPLTPSAHNWHPTSPHQQRGCSPTNGGVVVSTRSNRVGLPRNAHC